MRASASADGLYAALRREGVTHLFINKGEFLRVERSLGLAPAEGALLEKFWRAHLELVFPDYPRDPDRLFDYAFLRLVDAPAVPPPGIPEFLLRPAPPGGVGAPF